MFICPKCGVANNESNVFCLNCGAAVSVGPLLVSRVHENTEEHSSIKNVSKETQSKKNILIAVAAGIALIAIGVTSAAAGLAEPLIGKRYTSSELKVAKTSSEKIGYGKGQADGYNSGAADGDASGKSDGYASGKSDGYASGNSDGYKTGYYDGCVHVFDETGYDQVIGIYYPYDTDNLGEYYSTKSDTC